jgi:diketogulonate reductase-like aldo/keto reductase
MTDLTSFTLFSGDQMPSVGFGCWKVPKEKLADQIYNAITKAGYRCIDEAADYGNEKECGEGIKRALDEGAVTRKDLWVTSKLWNTYHRKEYVKQACLKTLQDLQLEYLDLYLVHFPISLKFVPFEKRYPPEWIHDPEAANPRMEEDLVPIQETWQAMEELVAEGLVRNIGFSNIGVTTLRDILSYAKVKPSVLQVELHPFNTQQKLLRFCREKGIAVTAYSSFGASSYVELGMAAADDSALVNPVVLALAKKYNKTPAQIALRWGVQRGTAVIPKTS